ncbi:MAG: hypothetical protein V4505_05895 [Pseudomonadota bacterium]
MSKSNPTGVGMRPTTDGTADNIGAGGGFDPKRPDVNRPAPRERMGEKRADAASVEQDDSAPAGLTEDAKDIRSDSRSPRSA